MERLKYIFKHGVVYRGIPGAIGIMLAHYLLFFRDARFDMTIAGYLGLIGLLFLGIGYLGGAQRWSKQLKQHTFAKSQGDRSSALEK